MIEPGRMVTLQGLICTNKEEQVYQSEYRDFTDAQTQIGCFEEDICMPKCNQSSMGIPDPRWYEIAWW